MPKADAEVLAAVATPDVASLQRLLAQHNLAAYIVPTSDAHNSEYVAEQDKRRVFISGFSGSY